MNLRWIGAVGFLTLSALVACSAAEDEGDSSESGATMAAGFKANNVIEDKVLRDTKALSVEDIQKLLDNTPWKNASPLAKYEEDGKSAAEIIHAGAMKHNINPLELIVRAQMEQGLISSKDSATAAAAKIKIALGCGCPHTSLCGPKYEGLKNQVECAAGTLDRSIDSAGSGKTTSGWSKGKTKKTTDGVSVTPSNASTAALYTYTPYVGEAGGGNMPKVGGASLHYKVWNQVAEKIGYGVDKPASDEPADAGKADANAEEPEEKDAGPAPTKDAGPNEDTDAGTPDSGPSETDAGTKSDAGSDAGSEWDEPSSDGSDDDVLNEGSAPPTSNGPSTGKSKDELTEASEDELTAKPKAQSGCSTSGGTGSKQGAILGVGVALALLGARRRKD